LALCQFDCVETSPNVAHQVNLYGRMGWQEKRISASSPRDPIPSGPGSTQNDPGAPTNRSTGTGSRRWSWIWARIPSIRLCGLGSTRPECMPEPL
jgi:hypothetical protein